MPLSYIREIKKDFFLSKMNFWPHQGPGNGWRDFSGAGKNKVSELTYILCPKKSRPEAWHFRGTVQIHRCKKSKNALRKQLLCVLVVGLPDI